MEFLRRALISIISFFILLSSNTAQGKVDPGRYGIQIVVFPAVQKKAVSDSLTRLLQSHPQTGNKNIIIGIQPEREMQDRTADFYLLLLVCVFLGLIRYRDPRYFQNMWRALWNPTLSARQIKDQFDIAPLSNLLMNIFFAIVGGLYLYYAVKVLTPGRTGNIPPALLILMLIAGIIVIYLGKYAIIRFSGWAFKVEGITEYYVFNIFLINKILAVVLFPFVVLFAFSDPMWIGPGIIISLIMAGLLLINRYTRSWQVFGSFFQYSKFHFFTYLCASELLPLAVLMKLLVRGLLY